MSVQRCPSCGRAWDGSLCFACGHEAGKAVAPPSGATGARVQSPLAPSAPAPPATAPAATLPIPSLDSPFMTDAPPLRPPNRTPMPTTPPAPVPAPFLGSTPTPAAMPGVAPTFAPLPTLPPLPRSPSSAFIPGAPPSGPAALPRFGTQSPAPVPTLGPPSFSPPRSGAPAAPAGGQLPPPPITFPGAPTTGTTRPRSAQAGGPAPAYPAIAPPPYPPPSSPAASAPALDLSLERTADTERPVEGVRQVARRVWASPGAFAIVFALGFVVTFGPGALWKLRSPDLQALIDDGQANTVVAILEAQEKDKSIGKGDWVLYGHAIGAAYGTYRRADMLAKYAMAVQSNRVDATALQNTIEALADPSVQRKAVEILKLDWPAELEPEARLQERTGDDNVLLRRGAVEALVARKAPSDMVRSARARVAVVDIKTKACPTAADGVAALKDLIAEKATAALRERKASDAVLDLQGDADLAQLPCIEKKTVRALHQELAALLESG